MNFFELKSENKVLIIIHKILLVTGILALLYIGSQLIDNFLENRRNSSF